MNNKIIRHSVLCFVLSLLVAVFGSAAGKPQQPLKGVSVSFELDKAYDSVTGCDGNGLCADSYTPYSADPTDSSGISIYGNVMLLVGQTRSIYFEYDDTMALQPCIATVPEYPCPPSGYQTNVWIRTAPILPNTSVTTLNPNPIQNMAYDSDFDSQDVYIMFGHYASDNATRYNHLIMNQFGTTVGKVTAIPPVNGKRRWTLEPYDGMAALVLQQDAIKRGKTTIQEAQQTLYGTYLMPFKVTITEK